MSRSNGVFTTTERKTALWALLVVALIAALAIAVQELSRPSLGPGGAEAYATASVPGVLDARPIS